MLSSPFDKQNHLAKNTKRMKQQNLSKHDFMQVESGTFSEEMTVPHSGEWVDVESRPDQLVVMGGEALQRLTDGRLFAVRHRVGLTGPKERVSLAFFLDPRPDAVLQPMEEFRGSRKGRYKPKFAGHKGVKREVFY